MDERETSAQSALSPPVRAAATRGPDLRFITLATLSGFAAACLGIAAASGVTIVVPAMKTPTDARTAHRSGQGGRENTVWLTDRRMVRGTDDGKLLVFDRTGSLIQTIEGTVGCSGRVRCVAASADGKRVATGQDIRGVTVFDLATGHEVFINCQWQMSSSIALSADGMQVLVGCSDGRVLLHDLSTGADRAWAPFSHPVQSVSFVGNRQLFAAARRGGFVLWDVGAAEHGPDLRPEPVDGVVEAAAVSQAGEVFAGGEYVATAGDYTQVFLRLPGAERYTVEQLYPPILGRDVPRGAQGGTAVTFSARGEEVVFGFADGVVFEFSLGPPSTSAYCFFRVRGRVCGLAARHGINHSCVGAILVTPQGSPLEEWDLDAWSRISQFDLVNH